MMATADIEQLCVSAYDQELRQIKPRAVTPAAAAEREFVAVSEDRYRLSIPGIGVALEIDRLRRDHNELLGELSVRCDLPGARTVNGNLSIADFNLSSARARTDRAKFLAGRAAVKEIDWTSLVEEFCQRVLQADRVGQPAVYLGKPDPSYQQDSMIDVDGLRIPRNHPTVLFGDGGTCKSYIALRLLGKLAEMDIPVLYIDWEFDRRDHEYRLSRLFPDGTPQILYARCERPLIYEADRLRRIVRENSVQYAVFDSAAYACFGAPESAENATAYFRAVRQIGGGSLHIAHISKAENGDKKPFGSIFWHNSARATWYVAAEENSSNPRQVALFNRKVNIDKPLPPVSYAITFTDYGTTEFRRADVANSPDLAVQLSVRQRMAYLLHRGAMDPEKIAAEVDSDLETVKRTVRRYKKLFTVLEGGRVGLLDVRS